MSAVDYIMAMLCAIAGMLAFLTLVEVGVDQESAGNVLMLMFFAGGLLAINPTLGKLYRRFAVTDKEGGDRDV
ncbi:hypothetical protein OB905_13095 [Halobacteria archaeon AArc-dxtr1]|nr:hypothetical protein [Halobacteria archaeon AArc-dxtr1]